MVREKVFENQIKFFLKELPNTWFYKNWGGGYSVSGIPDIIACVNGKFVGIEVKAEDGHPSALQLRNISLIEKSKGIGLIIYPKDFEMLKSLLKAVSEGKEEEFYKLG